MADWQTPEHHCANCHSVEQHFHKFDSAEFLFPLCLSEFHSSNECHSAVYHSTDYNLSSFVLQSVILHRGILLILLLLSFF